MFFALNSSLINLFQSTLPTRGSDLIPPRDGSGGTQFQSTLPTRGSDQLTSNLISRFWQFQSTLPTRGSDGAIKDYKNQGQHISIHAPHEGERREAIDALGAISNISIHAPHEGERLTGDVEGTANFDDFNPRSPRGGATYCSCLCIYYTIFQSTLPTRGSDCCCVC